MKLPFRKILGACLPAELAEEVAQSLTRRPRLETTSALPPRVASRTPGTDRVVAAPALSAMGTSATEVLHETPAPAPLEPRPRQSLDGLRSTDAAGGSDIQRPWTRPPERLQPLPPLVMPAVMAERMTQAVMTARSARSRAFAEVVMLFGEDRLYTTDVGTWTDTLMADFDESVQDVTQIQPDLVARNADGRAVQRLHPAPGESASVQLRSQALAHLASRINRTDRAEPFDGDQAMQCRRCAEQMITALSELLTEPAQRVAPLRDLIWSVAELDRDVRHASAAEMSSAGEDWVPLSPEVADAVERLAPEAAKPWLAALSRMHDKNPDVAAAGFSEFMAHTSPLAGHPTWAFDALLRISTARPPWTLRGIRSATRSEAVQLRPEFVSHEDFFTACCALLDRVGPSARRMQALAITGAFGLQDPTLLDRLCDLAETALENGDAGAVVAAIPAFAGYFQVGSSRRHGAGPMTLADAQPMVRLAEMAATVPDSRLRGQAIQQFLSVTIDMEQPTIPDVRGALSKAFIDLAESVPDDCLSPMVERWQESAWPRSRTHPLDITVHPGLILGAGRHPLQRGMEAEPESAARAAETQRVQRFVSRFGLEPM